MRVILWLALISALICCEVLGLYSPQLAAFDAGKERNKACYLLWMSSGMEFQACWGRHLFKSFIMESRVQCKDHQKQMLFSLLTYFNHHWNIKAAQYGSFDLCIYLR